MGKTVPRIKNTVCVACNNCGAPATCMGRPPARILKEIRRKPPHTSTYTIQTLFLRKAVPASITLHTARAKASPARSPILTKACSPNRHAHAAAAASRTFTARPLDRCDGAGPREPAPSLPATGPARPRAMTPKHPLAQECIAYPSLSLWALYCPTGAARTAAAFTSLSHVARWCQATPYLSLIHI